MTITTRKPTGEVPAPNVLLAGEEKSGKTYGALKLASDPRVGDTYVADVGEGCADQYGPLGEFLIIEHDGTLSGLAAMAREFRDTVPPADHLGRPNVLAFDSITRVWEACKDEAEAEARRRGKVNDDGSVNITIDQWNRAKARFQAITRPLLDWAGITVFTAQATWTAEVQGGKPTGKQKWTIDAHKKFPFDVDLIVRFETPRKVSFQGGRSLTLDIPEGKLLPMPGFDLGEFLFDKLGVGGVVTRNTQHVEGEMDTLVGKGLVVKAAKGDKAVAGAAWRAAGGPAQGVETVKESVVAAAVEAARAHVAGEKVLDLPKPKVEAPAPADDAEASAVADTPEGEDTPEDASGDESEEAAA